VVLSAAVRQHPHRALSRRERVIRFVAKPLVFVACLLPLAWVVERALADQLGANPIEAATRFLGEWGLRFLLLSLAVTPLRQLLQWPAAMRFRRMIGLFGFAYVLLHLTSYVALDQFFDLAAIWADIVKRTYITLGMAAFLLLVPLAVTSTAGWVKRLGAARWQRLHRLVYPAAALAVVHYYLLVKADIREPLVYAAILMGLLGWRAWRHWRPSPQLRPRRQAMGTLAS
jgi:sulfoxide reductase heme-binding subunit YedZ